MRDAVSPARGAGRRPRARNNLVSRRDAKPISERLRNHDLPFRPDLCRHTPSMTAGQSRFELLALPEPRPRQSRVNGARTPVVRPHPCLLLSNMTTIEPNPENDVAHERERGSAHQRSRWQGDDRRELCVSGCGAHHNARYPVRRGATVRSYAASRSSTAAATTVRAVSTASRASARDTSAPAGG